MEGHRESFAVRSYEVDAWNDLAVPALWGYLQEIAGLHADRMGYGVEDLWRAGYTWVLARQRLEITARARYGEVVEIETWPSGLARLAAFREFVVRRDGAEIARATSVWYVLDARSRRPVDPLEALDPRFPRPPASHVLSLSAERLPPPPPPESERPFAVRFADIDVNWHVNNVSYVQWVLEAVPHETWHERWPAVIEAQYLAECDWGGRVLSRAARAGDGEFSHSVLREADGKEIARACTRWIPR